MPISYSGDNVTFPDGSTLASGRMGMVNRIINGDMRIDQRNAGASGIASGYTVDRWSYYGSQSSKGTWQQNAGSVTLPTGFTNYLGFTSSSAYSPISTDFFELYQWIEGLNIADLGWGTANAKTVTLSFWVRSSLTGTFGGFLGNYNSSRVYPYTYTISSANTWEQKTVTIAGDTSGTWYTNNGAGIQVSFTLGAGSSYQGAGNAWNGGTAFATTGQTQVVNTNGATFYITGVDLRAGTYASAPTWEFRNYTVEEAMCKRYCHVFDDADDYGNASFGVGSLYNSANISAYGAFPVPMRGAPSSLSVVGTISNFFVNTPSGNWGASTITLSGSTKTTYQLSINAPSASGNPSVLLNNSRGGKLIFSAEL